MTDLRQCPHCNDFFRGEKGVNIHLAFVEKRKNDISDTSDEETSNEMVIEISAGPEQNYPNDSSMDESPNVETRCLIHLLNI